jgi:hypothetical protein
MGFMDCPKWQENGLLYVCGEADTRQSEEFKEHMKVCADCKNEADAYLFDKQHFFQPGLRGESPSEAIDRKIIAACSQKPVTTLKFSIFSGMWMRKALAPAAFLLIGLIGGAYLTMNYSNNNSGAALAKSKATSASMAQKGSAEATNIQLAKTKAGDSAISDKRDSLKANDAAFPSNQKSGGNIIPVSEMK